MRRRPPRSKRTDTLVPSTTLFRSRLQALRERLSLFVGIGAQFTDRNLDPSEKLALGGYRAVRAYPSGDVLVDEGAIANVELRYSMTDELTGFVFYDAARGDLNHHPGPFDVVTQRSLRRPGIRPAGSRGRTKRS